MILDWTTTSRRLTMELALPSLTNEDVERVIRGNRPVPVYDRRQYRVGCQLYQFFLCPAKRRLHEARVYSLGIGTNAGRGRRERWQVRHPHTRPTSMAPVYYRQGPCSFWLFLTSALLVQASSKWLVSRKTRSSELSSDGTSISATRTTGVSRCATHYAASKRTVCIGSSA